MLAHTDSWPQQNLTALSGGLVSWSIHTAESLSRWRDPSEFAGHNSGGCWSDEFTWLMCPREHSSNNVKVLDWLMMKAWACRYRVHTVLEISLKVLEFCFWNSTPLKVLDNTIGLWKYVKSAWIFELQCLKHSFSLQALDVSCWLCSAPF